MSPNCSLVTSGFQGMCDWATYSFVAAPSCDSTLGFYSSGPGGSCIAYASPDAKAGVLLGEDNAVNNGNTAWLLTCSAFIMIMSPAVGMFNAGLGDSSYAGNSVAMALVAMAIVPMQWFLFGYSFAFAPATETMGNFMWGCMTDTFENLSGAYGLQVPHVIFACVQCQYASFAAAIISGAVVNRMKFTTWCLFVFLWTTIVYDVFTHWMWSNYINPATFSPEPLGWLKSGAHSGIAALDFSGGIVVFVVSGAAGLAAAIVLGPRKVVEAPKPHDVPLVVLGASLMWFGWLGFAGASAFGANGIASEALWNVHISACCSSLIWMALEKLMGKQPSPQGACVGAVVGLVAGSAGCGFVQNWAALVTGSVAAPIVFFATKLRARFGPDDTLDVFAIYGVGGAVGAFCTGIFADPTINPEGAGAVTGFSKQIGYQMLAIAIGFAYSFIVTAGLLLLLSKTVGTEIVESDETVDVSEHGGNAYAKEGSPAAMGG